MAAVESSTKPRSVFHKASPIGESEDNKDHGKSTLMGVVSQSQGSEELYKLIDEGIDAARNGRVRPYRSAMASIRKKITGA